ncbi:MAG: FKBP-type peptidyl-prolyl cis-trans isomerase, partial [Lentisphaeria bacterium]
EEVAEALANLQERQKRIEKSDTAEAKVGDMLKLSYAGTIAGEEELSNRLLKAEESWMLVDEPEMIPGAKTILAGAKAGATIEATVNFPADFHEAELAGKTANYKFEVIEVHTSIIPEITDEFAKGLGLEDVADLKAKITDSLMHGKEQAEAGKVQEEALKAALAIAGDFDVSSSQIAEEVKTLKEDAANAEKSEEELFAKAKERVQSFYYLIQLAKEENVQITMQDMENRLQTMSYYSRKSPKLLQKELVKDGRINGVAMDVTLDKTIRRLADIATGKDTSAE